MSWHSTASNDWFRLQMLDEVLAAAPPAEQEDKAAEAAPEAAADPADAHATAAVAAAPALAEAGTDGAVAGDDAADDVDEVVSAKATASDATTKVTPASAAQASAGPHPDAGTADKAEDASAAPADFGSLLTDEVSALKDKKQQKFRVHDTGIRTVLFLEMPHVTKGAGPCEVRCKFLATCRCLWQLLSVCNERMC